MSDLDRQLKALRVIAVSGRAALSKSRGPEDRERIRDRMHELFGDLEQEVIHNGADEAILAAIEQERRKVSDE